jgi:uncharacterized protein (TIGR02246 family)
MKIRLLLVFVGLAIRLAVPAFAQQTNTSVSEQDSQQIEDAIAKKLEEACNKNAAAAVAAVFTEDAVQVAPEGLYSGRQAIEKRYADLFQGTHLTNYVYKRDQLNAIGNEAWAIGEWSCTVQSKNGPIQVKGYDTGFYVRDGDTWKIRVSTFNVTPPPPAQTK